MKIFKKYANTIIDLAKDTVSLSNGKELKSRGYINSRQFYKDCTGTISCISLNMISSRVFRLMVGFVVFGLFTSILLGVLYDAIDLFVLCIDISILCYWSYICARYIRLKDVLPAIWYFKALNEEYDKNDALFDVVFNSGIICNTEPHTNNISSYISVSDDHYMTDNLLYFYWSISSKDLVDYIPYSSDYIRWKKKYFNICNYIEIPLRIAMIVIMKSMCKSSLIKDEKVIEYFDKLDDDLLSKLVVDTALNSKKYDIDYFKMAFNTFINSLNENDFDDGRLEYEVSIIKARIYLAKLLEKEGYEINDDTFEISRISTSESSGS